MGGGKGCGGGKGSMKMVQKREKMGYKSKVSTAYKAAVASKWFLKLIFRRIGMNRPRLITSSFSKPSKVSFQFSCEYVFALKKSYIVVVVVVLNYF